MNKSNIYHRIEFGLTRLLLGITRLLPYHTRIRISGAAVAWLLRNLSKPKNRILTNLGKIFPEKSAQEKQQILGEVSRTFGQTLVEILNNDQFSQLKDTFIAEGPGYQRMLDNHKNGKSSMIVSAHYGQWEAARNLLKRDGISLGAVYRPHNNPYFEKLFQSSSEAAGAPLFPKGAKGTMQLIKHIRGGEPGAILIDQKYDQGEMLEFLGHPASTSTAPAEIALKYQIDLIPIYCERQDDGRSVKIWMDDPIPHSDPVTMMQAANDFLSAKIRQNPGQWYWMHDRWNFVSGR